MKTPVDHLLPVLDHLIQAKRESLLFWQQYDVGYTAAERLEFIHTVHVNFGRKTGQTFYMGSHATGDAIGIVGFAPEIKYLRTVHPAAQLYTLEELPTATYPDQVNIVFLDNPTDFFTQKNKADFFQFCVDLFGDQIIVVMLGQ